MSSSDNALGCMWVAVLGACVLIFASLTFGEPVLSGAGLSWDNSATFAREAARTERNYQDNLTRRRESDNWHDSLQELATVAGVVGVVLALGWTVQRSVAAWAARPHRPVAPPATVVMLAAPTLQAEPLARLEWSDEDGAWVIVNDRTMTVRLLEDRQHRQA